MNRRLFLLCTLPAALCFALVSPSLAAADPAAAVEQAHRELWRRFIDKHGVMIDFTDLDGAVNYPTPEEIRLCKPNALGWYQPIENGAMFNGLYLDAAINRWKHTRSADDAAQARRLAQGLLFLNSISDVPGFVGRGVTTDGKTHYPMGSNDQTLPWYYGLWRYWQSEIATPAEKDLIQKHIEKTTRAIVQLKWNMPAEPPYPVRGSFTGFNFNGITRQLFVIKLMHNLTGDPAWETQYRAALDQRGGKENLTRLEICGKGMVFEYAKTHSWTACGDVASLRGLWEMETDPAVKRIFAQGLLASAQLAAQSLPLAGQFDRNDPAVFNQDWRSAMLPLWKPQADQNEAQALADLQSRAFGKISPRRGKEFNFIREPCSAAWIVTLCPDADFVKQHIPAIETIITRYDYSKLYYCTFFWVESAWWRLRGI